MVITIFGLTASLVTASYLTFERNQRLKNAALTLKNELRLIQNRALSGDKAPPSDPESCYSKEGILVGWYLKISTANPNSYRVSGACRIGSDEIDFGAKTVGFAKDVSVGGLEGITGTEEVNILFRPLLNEASFYKSMAPDEPNFVDVLGNPNSLTQITPLSELAILLKNDQGSSKYKVIVKASGEVNEVKIP